MAKGKLVNSNRRNMYGISENDFHLPNGGGIVQRFSSDDIARNIVAAIRKVGQVPMPYQEQPDMLAVVGYWCDCGDFSKVNASVEIFMRTFQATQLAIWAASNKPNRASVHASPAEWKEQHARPMVFPDGSLVMCVWWPEVLWQRAFNPNPPLQVSAGGNDTYGAGSAKSINARFAR
jgi:hypothetical protein